MFHLCWESTGFSAWYCQKNVFAQQVQSKMDGEIRFWLYAHSFPVTMVQRQALIFPIIRGSRAVCLLAMTSLVSCLWNLMLYYGVLS